MAPKKKTHIKKPQMIISDAKSGTEWLGQLSEEVFRDQILRDLFSRLKSAGKIVDFLYTHGRNERGVDWIVQEKGGLSDRFVGIQAKSKAVTRQGGANTESSLTVKQQCESAFEHRFAWHGNEIWVDVVELWTSAPITADAILEFASPHSKHKISVKQASEIFSLVEQFCPGVISRIPGIVEANYLQKYLEPDALPIRILGTQLNPKKHFLEPRFSRHANVSPSRIFDSRLKKMREEKPVYLEDILKMKSNVILVGGDLSGKTYILKHISCLVAEDGCLPVMVDGRALDNKKQLSLASIIKEQLPWLSGTRPRNQNHEYRTICVLIDNIDFIEPDIERITKCDNYNIIAIATSKKALNITGFHTFFLSGVKKGAIYRFVRSLDFDNATVSSLTDRATTFIDRTIGTTGLPINPFTVSVILSECQITKRHLATPTMGRLITRFVENQLGSHTDSLKADFETKEQFLTKLGGKRELQISYSLFHRRLARFLAKHGHAHQISDFLDDLFDSGLLACDDARSIVRWSHAIFRDYFWVRNLVREKKFKTLSQSLLSNSETSLAAITGSQLGNAHVVMRELLDGLEKHDWMHGSMGQKIAIEQLDNLSLPTDQEEADMLKGIEDHVNLKEAGSAELKTESAEKADIDIPKDDRLTRAISLYVTRLLEEKHYLASNVSALLINARGLPFDDKIDAVLCVLRSNERMWNYFEDVLLSAGKEKIDPFKARSFSTFFWLVVNDNMLGDAFLVAIFRELARQVKSFTEKLAIADLRVACGSSVPSSYVKLLSQNPDAADIVSVYMRLVHIYYYRFHKEADRRELRDAMKELRHLLKGFKLPPVT